MSFSLKLLKVNTLTDTNLDYTYKIEAMHQENVTCLNSEFSIIGLKLTFHRQFQKHLINYILPSFIFVISSWISFVIPPEIVPGRMTLLITLLLVLINLFGTIIRSQPHTTTPTVLVTWTLFCMMFVIGALLAYAGILYYIFRLDTKTSCQVSIVATTASPSIFDKGRLKSASKFATKEDLAMVCKNWDKTFLICFPTLFLIFNLVFWPVVTGNNMPSEGHQIKEWDGTSIKNVPLTEL